MEGNVLSGSYTLATPQLATGLIAAGVQVIAALRIGGRSPAAVLVPPSAGLPHRKDCGRSCSVNIDQLTSFPPSPFLDP